MFDYQTVKLLHHHGGDTWVPMAEESSHDAAGRDPERAWLRGARIFKCSSCEEQIAMVPAAEPRTEAPGEVG